MLLLEFEQKKHREFKEKTIKMQNEINELTSILIAMNYRKISNV